MFGLPIEDANEWANFAYIVAGIVAIFATTMALMASFVMWRTSNAISNDKDGKLARFQSVAMENTARLEKSAAEANEKYALAEVRIAELKLQLARLQEPRNLDENQVKSLIWSLSQIEKLKFDVAVNDGDPEAEYFLTIMVDILQRAGWQLVDWSGRTTSYDRDGRYRYGVWTASGIIIVYDKARAKTFAAGADAVIRELTKAGLLAGKREIGSGDVDQVNRSLDPERLHVIVGRKSL